MSPTEERSAERGHRNRMQFVRRKERELEGLRPDIHGLLAGPDSPSPRDCGEILKCMERALVLLGRLRKLAERPLRRRQERILWYRTRLRFRELAADLHEGVRRLRRQVRE